MNFCVYILYSSSADKYYIGHTENINERLLKHNQSRSRYTKFVKDRKLVYCEIVSTRSEAMKHESEIKSKKAENILNI